MSIFGDIAGLAAINAAYQRLGNVGDEVRSGANLLATDLGARSQFNPFTVRSGDFTGTIGDVSEGEAALNIGISGRRRNMQQRLESLASTALQDSRPYGTGMFERQGNKLFDLFEANRLRGFDADAITVDPMENLALQSLDASGRFMDEAQMSTAAREQAIFDRIRAAQAPDEERQALALEERLASQGRLGVSTNLFGGTPEQLALAKAQSEARNTAMIQAMQQARSERALAGQLSTQFAGTGSALGAGARDLIAREQARNLQIGQAASGFIGGLEQLKGQKLQRQLGLVQGSFLPENQALNVLQQGMQAAGMQQQAQQFGAGLFGQATTAGLDALLASGLGQADLLGEVGAGVLAAGARSDEGGLFDALKKIFDLG
tara:strand:+ start:1695 stop:2825 length:1131 start_codon:yes stop_codon:yes gene_type:complete